MTDTFPAHTVPYTSGPVASRLRAVLAASGLPYDRIEYMIFRMFNP